MTNFAMTYKTISSGNWSSSSNWSTDDGATCCNCVPPSPSNGHDILVYHWMTLNVDIEISNNSYFLLYYSRSIIGATQNITVTSDAYVLLLSHVSINKLINGKTNGTSGGIIDIHHTFEISGQVNIYAGTVNLIGGYLYMPAGNFEVDANGTFNTSVGSKLELFSGNINNYGDIFICADCCIESIGNWTNESTGTVLGSGSALTLSGNMRNDNTPPSFSSDITWCTNGNDFGMPSNEDCATSTATCGLTVLPIELSIFEGENNGDINQLTWQTETENNTDYFEIQKSTDGFNWEKLAIVNGAGSSISVNQYQYSDQDIAPLNYYRLEQVDLNGESTLSNPISISSFSQRDGISIYPNPANQSEKAYITGLKDGEHLRVYDNNGRLVVEKIIEIEKMSIYNLDVSMFNNGMYNIHVTRRNNETLHSKLIIQ